jgi:hypothetical protein
MSLSGYGEHIMHLQNMCYGVLFPARGMYFGSDGFWLSQCQGNVLVYRQKVKWTDHGSADRIKEFFCDFNKDWQDISELYDAFDVKVADPLIFESSTTAFLGAGAYGRVIRVFPSVQTRPRNVDLFALKVSKYENAAYIESEHYMLLKHKVLCGCEWLVHPMCEKIKTTKKETLCGYIMQPVGERCVCSEDINKKTLPLIVHALYALHSHKDPIIHGDPRLQNLIMKSNESFFWIDVLPGKSATEHNFFNDLLTMLVSMFSLEKIKSSEEVQSKMHSYSKDCNEISLNELVVALIPLI